MSIGFLKDFSRQDFDGLVAGGALLTSFVLPHGEIDGLNLCPWFHLSGYLCPFCGMTRGFVAITHLDFSAAIDFNPGSPLIYAAFVFIALKSLLPKIKQDFELKLPKPLYYSWLTITILVFGFVAWDRLFLL